MKKIILYTLAIVWLFTSCAKEAIVEMQVLEQSADELVFVSNIDNSSDTKTSLDGLIILWEEADPVMIFGQDADGNAKVSGYAAHASGGSTTLDWTTNISGTEGAFTTGETPQYALYPTDATNASILGSTITFKLPETQTFAANSFGQGANVSVGKVKIEEGIADINFKNVCGCLKLQLYIPATDAANVGKIVLTTKGTEKLWGTFIADASSSTPVAAYKTGATDGSTSLTLDCVSTDFLNGVPVSTDSANPTVFYFIVPVGALASGFIAEVYSMQNHLMTTLETTKDISIVRNQINRMPSKSFNWIPAAYAELSYISTDRHQCIDTGYGNVNGFRFNFLYEQTDYGMDTIAICGVINSDDPYYYTTLDNFTGKNIRYTRNSLGPSAFSVTDGTHEVDASFITNNDFLIIDGDKKSISTYSTGLSLTFSACFPGAHKYNNGEDSYSYVPAPTGKWYFCDMYDETNTLIRQFIPAYLSTGTTGHQYGMYDVLNDIFYTNAYTGTGACDFNGGIIGTGEEDLTLKFESFGIDGGEVLGTVEKTISVCVPSGTDLTNLAASFTTTADKVCVGKEEQTSGATLNDFSSTVTYTLWKGDKYNNIQVKVYDFSLPVVWIETPEYAVVTSKNTWMENAHAKLYATGCLTSLGTTQIKGRGNTSWGSPKKPYTIKLDKKAAILGMPKDKRWNLLANWMDRTNMRNDVALQLARVSPGLDWTSRGEFVEFIMNGKHVGNYYLCEHIKIAENRVNITAIDEDAAKKGEPLDLTGGYLMEFDSYYDEANKFKSSSKNLPVNLKDPDWTTGFSITYIQDWINTLEKKLSYASSSDYKNYLDIDSYIDWWFVHEMAENWEPNHPKSSYMYKDKESAADNKIHAGPCWDFDWGTFTPGTSWIIKDAIWYSYLFNDPAFVARAKEKWNAQKSSYDAVANAYIDAVADEIKASVTVDKTLWPCTNTVNGDNTLSFDDAVARIKSSLQAKIAWMDTQISGW